MAIIVYCKKCGKKIKAPAEQAGRIGRCPRCRAGVTIPSGSEAAPPAGLLDQDAIPTPREAAEAVGERPTSLGVRGAAAGSRPGSEDPTPIDLEALEEGEEAVVGVSPPLAPSPPPASPDLAGRSPPSFKAQSEDSAQLGQAPRATVPASPGDLGRPHLGGSRAEPPAGPIAGREPGSSKGSSRRGPAEPGVASGPGAKPGPQPGNTVSGAGASVPGGSGGGSGQGLRGDGGPAGQVRAAGAPVQGPALLGAGGGSGPRQAADSALREGQVPEPGRRAAGGAARAAGRIAIDYGQKPVAQRPVGRSDPGGPAVLGAASSAPGAVAWDVTPDPRPSRRPLVLGLLLLAVLGLGGFGLWYLFWGRAGSGWSAEQRRREQFQVPESEDVWKDLRGQRPPARSGEEKGGSPGSGKVPDGDSRGGGNGEVP